ncbi:nuclear nucleic acid-binding protein C1D-like [Mercenaria mercenaria]|uniref:nuclear nucleic acid-binding protein C1D-like n=1 Tax=Mercenaria mercenaria TaxID=6596 RepID=UPI00234ECE87|nr:nuclear nucleic acid-binding protein C1D-like [Mercenaria mercenaria]
MSERDKSKRSEIPHELRGKLAAFDSALNNVENEFEPLLKVSQIELNGRLSTIDKAKLDLVAAYSINSLFWMYLNVCGVNPKDHGIKQELDRIRSYMNRVKEIQDKEKAPKLDVSASKRFVKSALWQAAQKQSKQSGSSKDTNAEEKYLIRKGKRRSDQKPPKELTEAKIKKAHKSRYMNLEEDTEIKKT